MTFDTEGFLFAQRINVNYVTNLGGLDPVSLNAAIRTRCLGFWIGNVVGQLACLAVPIVLSIIMCVRRELLVKWQHVQHVSTTVSPPTMGLFTCDAPRRGTYTKLPTCAAVEHIDWRTHI